MKDILLNTLALNEGLKEIIIKSSLIFINYKKILIAVKVPKHTQTIPINLRAMVSFLIFFVPQAPNGVAIRPTIAKIMGNKKFIPPFNKRYIENPAMEIKNSEAVVTTIDSFAFLPETICPAVTTGPNPPPEIDLLNALITLITSIFLQENLNFFLWSRRNPTKIISTPIYNFINSLGNCIAINTDKIVAITPKIEIIITVFLFSFSFPKSQLLNL